MFSLFFEQNQRFFSRSVELGLVIAKWCPAKSALECAKISYAAGQTGGKFAESLEFFGHTDCSIFI